MPTDATTFLAAQELRTILGKCPDARAYGERRAFEHVWRERAFEPVAFGATDCDLPEMYGHPDCVFAWLEFQEERVSSLQNDLAKALSKDASLAERPAVVVWTNNFLPTWQERRQELRASIQRKQGELEIFEGPPDNPEEDATPEHNELNEWARQIAQYQRDLAAAGVGVTPAEFKPEAPPSSGVLDETRKTLQTVALLGAVAVGAYLVVNLTRR